MSEECDYNPFYDGEPVFFGDDAFGPTSIEDHFKEILGTSLPEAKIDELTELVKRIAREDKHNSSDYARKTGWLFQLARAMMSTFPPDERKGGGKLLAPFALLFVEEVSKWREFPTANFNWHCREEVELAFETAWIKVKHACGEGELESAVAKAKSDNVTMFSGSLALVVSTGYWLSQATGARSFFLPVNDKTADLMEISKPFLSHCVLAAIEREFFFQSKMAIPHKKARTFYFNLNHEDLLPAYK